MAVEYQERRYIFNPIANRRKPMDVVKFQQPRNIPRPFAYNFYHDLESLMWLYIWFMIYHPPVHCVPESKLDSGASAEALLAVGDEYFSCGIDGSIPRYKMLEHGWDTIELLMYEAPVEIVYDKCRFLLAGLDTITHISQAYRELERFATSDNRSTPHLAWRADQFSTGIYRKFRDVFQTVLDMKEADSGFGHEVLLMRQLSSDSQSRKRLHTAAEDPDSPSENKAERNKKKQKTE